MAAIRREVVYKNCSWHHPQPLPEGRLDLLLGPERALVVLVEGARVRQGRVEIEDPCFPLAALVVAAVVAMAMAMASVVFVLLLLVAFMLVMAATMAAVEAALTLSSCTMSTT